MRYLAGTMVGAALVVALSCGGTDDPGPKPLRIKIDDMYLAPIPVTEQQAVQTAQHEYARAKMAFANATNSLDESNANIAIADNEAKQAKLDAESAVAKKDAADQSRDSNRMKAASRELKVAEHTVQAAQAKIDAWRERNKFLKTQARYFEENMYAKEANFELAKARLANSKNIHPTGFDYPRFQKQYQDRSRRAQRAKALSDRDKATSKKSWDRYKKLEAAAKKAKGEDGTEPPAE